MTVDPRTVIRDKVAEAIYTDSERLFPDVFPWSKLSAPEQDGYRKLADAAIAAHLEALEQANTIRTVEELDALPVGSVISIAGSATGDRYAMRRCWDQDWYCANDDDEGSRSAELVALLPARVLYRPEEA